MGGRRFSKAIVRRPGNNFAKGISVAGLGPPDYEKALDQHIRYCGVLKQCGVEVMVLAEEPDFPDAPFVQDTAILAGEIAVISSFGAETRRGEEKKIQEILSEFFEIKTIVPPGTLEGGDVVRVGDHYYIGISQRTNEEGAHQLASLLSQEGFSSSFVPVKTIPHLSTGLSYIGNGWVLGVKEYAELPEIKKSFNLLTVDSDENYAANCLSVNDNLVIPAGFPKTLAKIRELQHIHNITELEMSEFQKMDGSLTCLSLLF